MTDRQIIQALINRDEQVTRQFFFKDCRPLFVSVIRQIFAYEVDYDEFVNEFYLHLMENEACRLRQFQGRSTVYQWMKIVAIRYFWARKTRMIDNHTRETLMREEPVDSVKRTAARMDVESLLCRMVNKRQAYVVRRQVLDDAEPEKVAKELNVTVDNLYNIKKRAIAALTKIALTEAK